MAEPTPFLLPFFPPQEIFSFWGTSIAITPSGTQEVLPTPAERKYLTGSYLLTSSPSMTLTHPPIPLHRFSGSRSSPDISFAPSSPALPCSWEMLQDLGSVHLPILLSVPLSPAYRPNERPPSFNFQKVRWDGFAFALSICRGILVSFSFLCSCSLYLSGTKCGQIFHSFRPHQLHLSSYLKLCGRSCRNCLLFPAVLSDYNGSPDTRFSRGTTRLMS